MSGGGIGSAIGTGIGLALAPETGGLSMLIPALTGAVGGAAGAKLTGGNPLVSALMGGIGGGLGGFSGLGSDLGISNAAGLFGDGAAGAAGAGLEDIAPAFATDAAGLPTRAATDAFAAAPVASSPAAASGIGGWLGKQNPLSLALAGNTALSAADNILHPLPKYNVAQNANNVFATNPGFNAPLPKYTMQNTATPYTGNWYTYGETPQPAMYNAQPVLAQSRGGIVGYAHGGQVHKYAAGGMPMGMPASAVQPQIPVNPLTLKAVHEAGVVIGKHLKSRLHTPDGQVRGAGGGQDDAVPAKLSQDEYILPADVVSQIGDGSSNEGGKKLDAMVHNVRHHKAVKRFPPKARNPLSYLPKKVKA